MELQTRNANPKAPILTADSAKPPAPGLEHRLFLLLAAVALVYAFLSGLRTISDPDLFWQLATGRWVAQHHQVFSVDVFSYTAAGAPWIYPVGSGLLFYAAYLLGGYVLLSWMGAAACCATIAILLRKASAISAAIAIIAVPLIAQRTAPRAEMFTVLLFAAYISVLWEHYSTGRAGLWLLPLLMLAWVNLHLGFVAGLGLVLAFAVIDVLDTLLGRQRREARARLERSWFWFAATFGATLGNPWGWGIYRAVIRQNRAMAEHSAWIPEWGRVPFSWTAVARSFSLNNPQPFYILLVVVAVGLLAALRQRRWGAAVLLIGAVYEGIRHVRMGALAACVVVVIAGAVLTTEASRIGAPISAKRRMLLAGAATILVAMFGLFNAFDAAKIHDMALASYGAGLSWWYPERAAEFIEQANIPSEIFNTYIQGGFMTWRLGPERRDYIDGRAIPFGPRAFVHQAALMQAPPDSVLWLAEAERYNINTLIFPLNRFDSALAQIKNFCDSSTWRPVYLDQEAGVFVRRTPQNEEVLRHLHVDCATAPLPATAPAGSDAVRFNAWADSAAVLAALGRNSEALTAAEKANQIFPNSSFVPWLRGTVDYTMGIYGEAEGEYLQAIARNDSTPLFWFSLATVYKHDGRIPETIQAQRRAIELSTMPQPRELVKLARLYLDTHQPRAALKAFNEAVAGAPPDLLSARGAYSLQFQADQGRAAAYRALGDVKRAQEFEQRAVQDLVPQE